MTPDAAAAATDAAWRDHHTAVQDMLMRRCRNYHLAEDLAAETFLRMLRFLSADPNEEPTHLRAWLFTIARNLLADYHRAPSAHRELLSLDPAIEFDAEPEHHTEAHVPLETWEGVLHLLELLPEHQRLVVILRGINDLSVAETAEILGISQQAVRYLKHDAKKRLAEVRHRVTVLDPQDEPDESQPNSRDVVVLARRDVVPGSAPGTGPVRRRTTARRLKSVPSSLPTGAEPGPNPDKEAAL